MRVLVTGAAGFLGRHVARHLLEEGFAVSGFDLRTFDEPRLEWIVGDLCVLEDVRTAAVGHDAICHIGAVGDVYVAAQDPALAGSVNVVGSANVAEAALAAGCKVVYASTWEVYGQPHYQPVDEDHPCAPDHPYNITKFAGEQLLLSADRLRDLPVTSLRLGTAYGTGLRPNSVLSVFIDKARRGEPITIQGDGSQSRQFTHARDIARAFAAVCRSDARGVALNALATELVSVKQLAELIVARLPTDIRFSASRPGDIATSLVSSERIRRMLGWEAETPFEEGLNHLIDSVTKS